MKTIKRFLIFPAIIVLVLGSNPFLAEMDTLVTQNSKFSDDFKTTQVKNKGSLMTKFCSQLKNHSRIILVEKLLRGNNESYGVIYTFNDNEIYSFQHQGNSLKTAKGNFYDRFGELKRFVTSLKDSTIDQLKRKKEENDQRIISDAQPMLVFYIDLDNKINELFIY